MTNRGTAAARKLARCACAALAACALAAGRLEAEAPFIRGDTNQDGRVDISDAVNTLGVLFLGLPQSSCRDAEDANDDGGVDIADPVFTLNFLFNSGAPLPPPSPECGADPTADALSCDEFPALEGCSTTPACIDAQGLDRLAEENIPEIVCIPAGASEVDILQFTVAICPPGDAQATCGDTGEPGCPVVIESITIDFSSSDAAATLHIKGAATDLPVVVTGQGEVTCTAQIPFEGDAILDLDLVPAGEGAAEVTAVTGVRLENVEASITAEGGLLCDLLAAAAADSLNDLLTDALDGISDELLAGLDDVLTGAVLCVP